MDELKKIVVISDGTGGTAKRLMDAVLVQYTESDLQYSLDKTYPQVRTVEEIDQILNEINDEDLILFSIISRDLSGYFHHRLAERGILHLNVLKPMLDIVSKFLGVHPDYQPGILMKINDRYYGRIEAIGYTVKHDDGQGGLIEQADVVLLGLSRSCKTPISVFLAVNYGLKVANIPVVKDKNITDHMLRRLRRVDSKKIVGLLMRPEKLIQLREERSNYLSFASKTKAEMRRYFELSEVRKEYRYCRELFETKDWHMIDVTSRAIEEVSKEVLEYLGLPFTDTVA